MKRKEFLEYLKDKKTIEQIKEHFNDIEGIEEKINNFETNSYIRYLVEGDEIFYETINNDFSKKKAREIGKLTGYICSNPKCRRFTLAPSKKLPEKLINIGEAAHIYGNKPNSARFNKELSTDEISNGLWLCKICHKMIDSNNGLDYPAPILKNWKEDHAEWLRESLFKPYELVKGQDWLSYIEWKDYILNHNNFLYKIDSYISKYSKIISTAIQNVNIQDIISIRILGPPNIGKKTILNDALEKCSKEQREQIFIYFIENESILNKKYPNNTIIVIQECSNEFHSLLLKRLQFNRINDIILISLGSDYNIKGIDKNKTEIIKIEGLNENQTGELLQNFTTSISYSEIKKIYEWSGVIPGLILDMFNLFKKNKKKLDNIEDYNLYWEENFGNFIQKSLYPRNEVINLINKIALLFQILYSWDPNVFEKSYLPYLSGKNKDLSRQIIKDLLSEKLLMERNGYISIFPPLTSLYIIKEKVEEDNLIEFLIQIIESKNVSLIDSFIEQINYLDNRYISNQVAYILFNKIKYTSKSLKEDYITLALYRLSELFPNDALRIISTIISNLKKSDSIEINNNIFNILIDLAGHSDLFFDCFNILINILTVQWNLKIQKNFIKLEDLFFKSDIPFITKIDFIKRINTYENPEKEYIITDLATRLINIYGVSPRSIIESKNSSEERALKLEKYKHEIKQSLIDLWELILKFIKLEDKGILTLYLEKINKCFLSLYCSGLWDYLLKLWNNILEKFPDLKIFILREIRFSPIYRNYSNEDDFNSLKSFCDSLKKHFNILEELEWFIHYETLYEREPYNRDYEGKKINQYAEILSKNPEDIELIISFLHNQESYIVAELGANLAQLDKNFKLWTLIETTFLKNIRNSSTDFLNGYTHIIFQKNKKMWDAILTKFEKIDELKSKLYKFIIPKLPYKRHLDLLIELYEQGFLPKEKLRTMVYSLRKEKVIKSSFEDLITLFKFYFNTIDNPLNGIELHYIDEWLTLREYLIPVQLKNQFIEVLTSFEKINQYQFYLAPNWDEIVNKIHEKDKVLYKKIRDRILEKIKDNLNYSLFNRLILFLTESLKEEYDEVIDIIKEILIKIASSSSNLGFLLQKFDINLLRIDTIIELCRTKNKSILYWIIEKKIHELLQTKEIPKFFNMILNEFPYDDKIIQFSYKSILRAKDFKHEKDHLIYLSESKKQLEFLLNKDLPVYIQYWLDRVIKKLESKIKSYSK